MANPLEFFQQVRAEVAKVVWPTRNETVLTTVMVLIMATLAALFFLLADQVFILARDFLLQVGR
ncbi:MAG: preprotein translocase subunit SecE [Hyphomicrobiales bacterium]|nr:preprotein translocase subunit SecE [Hyphomicrobiales bacterium]